MGGLWGSLVLVAVLVLVNAIFSGTEMALVSLRASQLHALEEKGKSGVVLVELSQNPTRFLAAIQVGITLAGFLASAAAATALAAPLADLFGFFGSAAQPISIVAVTLLLSYFTLVFGELVPKRLAMQRAEKWGLAAARPLSFVAFVAHPAIWLLEHSTDVVVRLLRGDPKAKNDEVTIQEVRAMVDLLPEVSFQHRQVIDGAFEVAQRTLAEVLVPRREVFVVDVAWSCKDAVHRLVKAGHSRAPVAPGGSLDFVSGTVHVRQLLANPDFPVSAMATQVTVFPESAKVLEALQQMQSGRTQMAVVVDEHGGAAGIVTVEDLVEELVGEIYDEADRDFAAVKGEGGSFVVPGRFPVHDLSDIGVDLPPGDYTTVAGLFLSKAGAIPNAGDFVVVEHWMLVASAVEGRTITEVTLVPQNSLSTPN